MAGIRNRRSRLFWSLFGLLLGLIWFFPILWILFSSLQPNSELLIYPPRIIEDFDPGKLQDRII